MADDDTNVQVFCRVRPPNERESAFAKSCVTVAPDARSVVLAGRHSAARTFTFDRAFSERAAQRDDAARLAPPDAELRGLVPRVFDYLFDGATAAAAAGARVQHTFACSFLEIYNERVFDLLDGGGGVKDAAGLALRENGRKGVFVEGLVESVVASAAQAAQLMAVGAQNRRVGQTAMNRESSRSHSVFILQIRSRETTPDGVTREEIQRLRRQLHDAQLESALPPLTSRAEPASLAVAATAASVVAAATSRVAPCDPATDSRFRALEAAFASSVEKNGQLKRAHERLKTQEEHRKALCAELKRHVTHLRMLARLRQGGGSSSGATTTDEREKEALDYEPSVDAIEWRVKYEELEESYAELQDALQQRRMAEQAAGGEHSHSSHVEGEVERLNLMLQALTQQLASVVRDKHELQDRLLRVADPVTGDARDAGDAAVRRALVDSDGLVAQLREALATQAHTLTAKADTALAARDAAAAKAQDAARELLAMKQKEAAWSIQVTERDIRLQDSARLLRQAEEARVQAGAALMHERQQHQAALVRASQAHATARLELDAQLADALTSQRQLAHELRAEAAAASALRDERDVLAGKVRALSAQVAALTADVAARDEQLARQSRQHALDLEQQRAQLSAVRTAMDGALQQKAEELAALASRFDAAARDAAAQEAAAQRTHEDRVQALESAAAALQRDYERKCGALESAVDAAQQRTARLESDASALQRKLESAESAAVGLEQRISEQQQVHEQQQAALERHRQTIEALQAARDELAHERERLRAEASEQTAAIATLEQSRAELTQCCDGLRTDVAARDEAAQTRLAEIAVLTEQLGAATLREDALVTELATEREQRGAASDAHSAATKRLQAAHAAELQSRLESFARQEAELRRAHDAQLRGVESAKAALQQAFDSERAALERDAATAQRQAAQLKSALDEAATATERLELELHDQRRALEWQQAELVSREQAITTLQAAHDTLRSDADERDAALEQSRAELAQQVDAAASREQELAGELVSVREKLATAVEAHSAAVVRLQAAHARVVAETNQAAVTQIAEMNGRLSASARTLEASKATERDLNDSLLSANSTKLELNDRLSANLECVQQAARKDEKALRDMQKRLEQRAFELERKSARADVDQQAAATERQALESTKADYRKCKLRVAELEPLVAQLQSDRQRLERECALQAARLENMTKANDKLVGHDNKRQKIQYHLKVKDENNRLLVEVQQLKADKSRLQTKLDKVTRLALKEKENVGEGVGASTRTAGASSAASSANTKAATGASTSASAAAASITRPPGMKKLLPVTSGLGGLESSSLATAQPNKKRQHSRMESGTSSLLDVARATSDHTLSAMNESNATRSLADVAKKQATSTTRPQSLVGLAGVTIVAAMKPPRPSSVLQSLAQVTNENDAKRGEHQPSALAEVAAKVQRQEAHAEEPTPTVSTRQTVGRANTSATDGDRVSDDGYSSFGDEEEEGEDKKPTAMKPKALAPTRKQQLLNDDENESEGEADAPERTTASDSAESKAFLRAVYRADMRKVQDMLDSGDASVTTADQGHTKILELLLKKGASIDAVEHINGWTPLHVAAVRELLPCVKLLLRSGASARIKDSYGDSASDILRSVRGKKRERILQMLLQFAPSSGA
ncbi:hypothetical protein PybrP1_011104 [[Pythium] brassicae (nom. inval.)]|nr:hypothetical protein PybrP1_011104 [[Pythium] brassicae (nom. inval.)]